MTQRSQPMRPDVISLADEERVNDVVLGAVLGLWGVVNNLTRLRPSRRDRYRVTIFGSARATPGSFAYEETRRAASVLAAMGCDIVTGGGPGLMQAANEGASTAPGRARSIGIRRTAVLDAAGITQLSTCAWAGGRSAGSSFAGSRPEAVACQGRIRHRRELPAAHRRLPSFVAGGAEKENERVGRLVVLMVGWAWALTLVSAGMRNEVL